MLVVVELKELGPALGVAISGRRRPVGRRTQDFVAKLVDCVGHEAVVAIWKFRVVYIGAIMETSKACLVLVSSIKSLCPQSQFYYLS